MVGEMVAKWSERLGRREGGISCLVEDDALK